MAGRIASEHHAKCLDMWAAGCVVEMRRAAREFGYTLTTHGSMRYDIDVVAIPWVDDAKPADELIPALRAACEKVTELPVYAHDRAAGLPEDFSEKPHGRRAWSWSLGGGAYVDCSVMPRMER